MGLAKSCFLSTLGLLCGITLQAQVVKIDSIPTTGLLLQQGWRWYAGDHSAFANPNFDDTNWQTIDPTQDIMALPQVRNTPVSWFRIRLMLKDSTCYQKLALAVRQTGATELYLNGKPLYRFGKVASNRADTKGYDPSGRAIALPLEMGKANILAVRFAFPDIFLTKGSFLPNPCLNVAITRVENITQTAGYLNIFDLSACLSGIFKSGIMLLLAVLHFWFFLTFPKQKANLFFSLFAFLTFLITFGGNIAVLFITDLYIRNAVFIFCTGGHPLITILPFVAVYLLLNIPRDTYFWTTVVVATTSIPLMFRPYFTGHLIAIFAPLLLVCIGIFNVAWKAASNGNRSASGLYVAVIVIFVSYAAYFWGINVIDQAWVRDLWSEITFDATVLALPVALSYYLALDFAQNKAQIEQNFLDFQRLAAEKETSLRRQNAELQAALLQGQTLERKRVAADLHDNLGATMSSLLWTLDAIDTPKLQPNERQIYQSLKQMVANAYNEVRLLSHNLLPEEFEKQGLVEALRYFVRKINQNAAICFDLHIDENIGKLDKKVEFELYSICLELVNNIMKHSKATQATIELHKHTPPLEVGGLLTLIVSDNGKGIFDNNSDGKGMKNVWARVESLGGEWKVIAEEGRGVKNQIAVPV